jgi:hypothetical protein
VVFQLGLLLPPPNHFDSLTSGPIFGVHLTSWTESERELIELHKKDPWRPKNPQRFYLITLICLGVASELLNLLSLKVELTVFFLVTINYLMEVEVRAPAHKNRLLEIKGNVTRLSREFAHLLRSKFTQLRSNNSFEAYLQNYDPYDSHMQLCLKCDVLNTTEDRG